MAYQQLKTSFDTLEIPSLHLWRDHLPALGVNNVYAGLAVALGGFLLLLVATLISSGNRKKIDLPGPTGWPLIGIGLDLPKRPRKMLNEYRAKYGDAFKMRLGWYDWVFFNTPEAVKEVFDKQVSSYQRFIRSAREALASDRFPDVCGPLYIPLVIPFSSKQCFVVTYSAHINMM